MAGGEGRMRRWRVGQNNRRENTKKKVGGWTEDGCTTGAGAGGSRGGRGAGGLVSDGLAYWCTC